MQDWVAVQEVYRRTRSIRKTASILGISRNTVRSLLRKAEEPKYQRSTSSTKIDDFKEDIIRWRDAPYNYNGTRIHKELKKLGYEGSISPVYRFLRFLNEEEDYRTSRKASSRHESPPGDQAQFDWTEYNVMLNGVYTKVYCFSLILAYSRKKVVQFSLKEDGDAIYEAIQSLFDELGGVTLELLIDNPKALVLENNPRTETDIRYNAYALLMARHIGIELNACPYYWPRKKGKVESPFKYIEEQFIKGSSFHSMEELNLRGKQFVNEWCDHIHTTTQKVPNDSYHLEERKLLRAMPAKHYYRQQPLTRKVSNDCYVHISSNKYSVPSKYVGHKIKFRILYGYLIIIYTNKEKEILRVEALRGRKGSITNPDHYVDITPVAPTSLPQIRRDFTSTFENGAKYMQMADSLLEQPTRHMRKILEYLTTFEVDQLNLMIGIAIERKTLDIVSFRKIIKECCQSLNISSPQSEKEGPKPSLIRDLDYYEEIVEVMAND